MTTVDSSLVAHLPLFAGIAADDLAEILREARSTRYAKNSAVFEQGEDAQSFFLLLHGHVRASKTTPTGEQIVVRYVAPGEIFGVAPAIGIARYPATATAGLIESGRQRIVLREPHRIFVLAEHGPNDGEPPRRA